MPTLKCLIVSRKKYSTRVSLKSFVKCLVYFTKSKAIEKLDKNSLGLRRNFVRYASKEINKYIYKMIIDKRAVMAMDLGSDNFQLVIV